MHSMMMTRRAAVLAVLTASFLFTAPASARQDQPVPDPAGALVAIPTEVVPGGRVELFWQARDVAPGSCRVTSSMPLMENTAGLAVENLPVMDPMISVISEWVYAFGGRQDGALSRTIYRAPLEETSAWTRVGELPEEAGLDGAGFLMLGPALYIIGGETQDMPDNRSIWAAGRVNPAGGWHRIGELPEAAPARDMAITAIGNFLYILGGETGSGPTDAIWRADASLPVEWQRLPARLPAPEAGADARIANDRLYLVSADGERRLSAPLSNPVALTAEEGVPAASGFAAHPVLDYPGGGAWRSDGNNGYGLTRPVSEPVTLTLECAGETLASEMIGISPALDAPLALSDPFEIILPGRDAPQGDIPLPVPQGWALHAPQIISTDDVFYVSTTFACPEFPTLMCLRLMRNGREQVAAQDLVMGGSPETARRSYQPPGIYLAGDQVFAISWFTSAQWVSSIAIDRLDLSSDAPQWQRVTEISDAPNYLGGTMGPDGTIYFGGWSGYGTNALQLYRLAAPYAEVEGPIDVASYNGANQFQALYPHILVRPDGRLSVLTVLENGQTCEPVGRTITAYKTVVVYEGEWGGDFRQSWSNSPRDVVRNTDNNGDVCRQTDARFPQSYVLSPADGRAYAAISVRDRTEDEGGHPLIRSFEFSQRFEIRADGEVLVRDAAPLFDAVFGNPLSIEVVNLAVTPQGDFVIFALNRGSERGAPRRIGVVTTRDFETFSPARWIDAPDGAGHIVITAQPGRNSTEPFGELVLMFTGSYHLDGSEPADIYDYRGGIWPGIDAN